MFKQSMSLKIVCPRVKQKWEQRAICPIIQQTRYLGIPRNTCNKVLTVAILNMYTERQKKLITSSQRDSLKSTASKLIIFRHIKGIVLLMKHI